MRKVMTMLLSAGVAGLFVASSASAATITFQNGATSAGLQVASGGYQGTSIGYFSTTSGPTVLPTTVGGDVFNTGTNASNAITWTGLLRFDLTSLDGLVGSINSVTLTLWGNPRKINETFNVSLHSVLPANTGWSARSTAQYLNFDTEAPWASGGKFGSADYASAALATFTYDNSTATNNYREYTINLSASLIEQWISGDNDGFLAVPDVASKLAPFWGPAHGTDGSGAAGIRPRLVIDYNPVPEPMTGSLLLIGGLMVAMRRQRQA